MRMTVLVRHFRVRPTYGLSLAAIGMHGKYAMRGSSVLSPHGVPATASPSRRGRIDGRAAVANTGSGSGRLVSVTAGGSSVTVRDATSTSPLAGLPGNDVTIAGNSVIIPGGSAVSFGQPGRPSLRIADSSVVPGHFTRVEFGFAGIGQTAVNALVMSNTGLFDSYNLLSPSPSPSPRSRAASNPSASPTVTATAAPTTTAAAKTSTELVLTPHPTGSREPRR